MPPVTRSYICLSVLTTGSVAFEVISPYKLYLNWSLVLSKLHIWRLLTNFLFFGEFSIDFIFHMFFLYRHCKMLEINTFRGRTADFLFMLLFGGAVLVLGSPFTKVYFLGPSLTFMMVYVWGRKNSRQVVNFLGLFSFSAPYLPWVLLLFSFIVGASPTMDLLGIFAGHVYYFMTDVYPQMAGVSLLPTPRLLKYLVGNNDEFEGVFDVQQRLGGNDQNNNNNGNAAPAQGGGWGQGRLLDGGANQNQ